MQVVDYALEKETLNQTKSINTIFRISKRLSKLIIKDIMKSRKNNKNIYTSIYTNRDSYSLPIYFVYDGIYIQCTFFSSSLYPEKISILPDEVHELAENICINIEKIFDSLPTINLQNFDFKVLPGLHPTSESIISFSYDLIK